MSTASYEVIQAQVSNFPFKAHRSVRELEDFLLWEYQLLGSKEKQCQPETITCKKVKRVTHRISNESRHRQWAVLQINTVKLHRSLSQASKAREYKPPTLAQSFRGP